MVTRLAITGHRKLPQVTSDLVYEALRAELSKQPGEVVGISCLADGADSLFARAVLDRGGSLVVIVPAENYRNGLPREHHQIYDELLHQATEVIRLSHIESTSESHMAASIKMLERADRLVAVWDGKPARGYGGTADVVSAARERGIPVTVVWPEGAHRE